MTARHDLPGFRQAFGGRGQARDRDGETGAELLAEGGQAPQRRAAGRQQARRPQHRDDAADAQRFGRARTGSAGLGHRHQHRRQQGRRSGLGQQLGLAAGGHRLNQRPGRHGRGVKGNPHRFPARPGGHLQPPQRGTRRGGGLSQPSHRTSLMRRA